VNIATLIDATGQANDPRAVVVGVGPDPEYEWMVTEARAEVERLQKEK
jgi:hypothetical protein